VAFDKQREHYMTYGRLNMLWVIPPVELVAQWAMEKIERAFGPQRG
jgi:superfamily II DNA or RNA helicase